MTTKDRPLLERTFWCVITPAGWPWHWTIAELRQDAIEKCLGDTGEAWKQYRQRGYTVRRVRIVEDAKA